MAAQKPEVRDDETHRRKIGLGYGPAQDQWSPTRTGTDTAAGLKESGKTHKRPTVGWELRCSLIQREITEANGTIAWRAAFRGALLVTHLIAHIEFVIVAFHAVPNRLSVTIVLSVCREIVGVGGDGGIRVCVCFQDAGGGDVVELESDAGRACSSNGRHQSGERGSQRLPHGRPSGWDAEGRREPRQVQHQPARHSSRGRHSLRRWKEGEGGATELRQEGQGARQGGRRPRGHQAAVAGGAAAVALQGGESRPAHRSGEPGLLAQQDREPGVAVQGRGAGRAVRRDQPQHARRAAHHVAVSVAAGPRVRLLRAGDLHPSHPPANPCGCHFGHRRLGGFRRFQFCFHFTKLGIELLLQLVIKYHCNSRVWILLSPFFLCLH